MSLKLYELSEKYQEALDAAIDLETGEIKSEMLFQELDSIGNQLEEKCLDVACLIKSIDAEAEAIKAEENILSSRRRTLDSKASYLKRYLSNSIPEGKKFSDSRVVISWRKSTQTICSLNEQELIELSKQNPDLVSVRTSYSAKLKEMKEFIEVTPIMGIIVNEKQNLQIK